MELDAALSFVRSHRNGVLTTLQRSGRPQLSNIVYWVGDDGIIRISATDGRAKSANLRRDPRVAVHSCPEDMPGWSGDARLAGTAVEVTDPETLAMVASAGTEPPGPFELFRVDITEAVSVPPLAVLSVVLPPSALTLAIRSAPVRRPGTTW